MQGSIVGEKVANGYVELGKDDCYNLNKRELKNVHILNHELTNERPGRKFDEAEDQFSQMNKFFLRKYGKDRKQRIWKDVTSMKYRELFF